MTPDHRLSRDVQAAQLRHDKSRCKCRTKIALTGNDGPSYRMLHAAWRLAEAVDRYEGAPGVPANQIAMMARLTEYQAARRGR